MSHIWMGYDESCHTYGWVMSHIWVSHVPHMRESLHTHGYVLSHTRIRHVTHMNMSGHISVCVMSRTRVCRIHSWWHRPCRRHVPTKRHPVDVTSLCLCYETCHVCIHLFNSSTHTEYIRVSQICLHVYMRIYTQIHTITDKILKHWHVYHTYVYMYVHAYIRESPILHFRTPFPHIRNTSYMYIRHVCVTTYAHNARACVWTCINTYMTNLILKSRIFATLRICI